MSTTIADSIGLRARIERIRRRLKQSELASLAGVTQADVSALELDKPLVSSRRRRILRALELEEVGSHE